MKLKNAFLRFVDGSDDCNVSVVLSHGHDAGLWCFEPGEVS